MTSTQAKKIRILADMGYIKSYSEVLAQRFELGRIEELKVYLNRIKELATKVEKSLDN